MNNNLTFYQLLLNVTCFTSTFNKTHPPSDRWCFLHLEHGALSPGKEEPMRGENVYLNPYSHIDQSPVEVRLARDNNGPDLATRHVSVLLSFSVIDPAGLLSAAWIHSWASSPRYTAVTRHKEGSISTAPGIACPPPPPPARAFKITPSAAGGKARQKRTRAQRQQKVEWGGARNGGRGGGKLRAARKGKGLIALRRGHESNAEVSPQIKTPCGSSSVSRQHERLCSRACITTWL